MTLQDDIDRVAKDIRFGKIFIEATIHDGKLNNSNLSLPTRSKKYDGYSNNQAAEDFLNLIRWAQENNHSGTLTFTAVIDKGIVKRATHDEIRRSKYF